MSANSVSLFSTVFGLIFLAELPDKTVFATLFLSTRHRPVPVFAGIAAAYLVQNGIAVLLAKVLLYLPSIVLEWSSGLMFLYFAVSAWRKTPKTADAAPQSRSVAQAPNKGTSWRSARAAFVMIFIAEWGDFTQLATAALIAKNPDRLWIVFLASTLALWLVSMIFIGIGHYSKKFIDVQVLQKTASIACGVAGSWILIRASLRLIQPQ